MFAVVLLLIGGSGTITEIPFTVKIPSIQGSMRIYYVDNETLKFTNDLKYIGNVAARTLRRTVEPKVSGYL